MSLVMKLPKIMEDSRKVYAELREAAPVTRFKSVELVGGSERFDENYGNMLARGDNLDFMKFLLEEKGFKGKINLIYADPPFFSKAKYGTEIKLRSDKIKAIPVIRQKAFNDIWEKGIEEYLRMLSLRLLIMKDLLAEDGCIWLHLDWHAVHYVKVLMDEIFGGKNFINEVIWHYKSGGVSKKHFARKHDTLLFYGKSRNYYFTPQREKSYNRGFKPYRFKGVKEFKDDLGWYTMVNRKDVWQLDMVGRTSSERTGYVTQKPETLIERILESCTREGDICADFFGGSGTMAAAADKMKRRWISCDIGRLAAISSHKRMIKGGAAYSIYEECSGIKPEEEKGSIQVKTSVSPDPISDKMVLKIELEGYTPYSFEQLPIQEQYLPVIKNIIDKDSIQLIAYWSVDCRYSDGINRPDFYFLKEEDGIETRLETIGWDFGPVYIKAVDVFGNSASCCMQVSE